MSKPQKKSQSLHIPGYPRNVDKNTFHKKKEEILTTARKTNCKKTKAWLKENRNPDITVHNGYIVLRSTKKYGKGKLVLTTALKADDYLK